MMAPLEYPQGLENADVGPVVLHHPRHGGDAHQGCHQEKEDREDTSHAGDNARVVFKADVSHIGVAAQRIAVCPASDPPAPAHRPPTPDGRRAISSAAS